MDFNNRIKSLKSKLGFVTNEKLEERIDNGTITDSDSDFVWNSINLVALIEIKAILEKEIPDVTATLMECLENEKHFNREIPVLNHFVDVMVAIKEKVDNTAAGNVNISSFGESHE